MTGGRYPTRECRRYELYQPPMSQESALLAWLRPRKIVLATSSHLRLAKRRSAKSVVGAAAGLRLGRPGRATMAMIRSAIAKVSTYDEAFLVDTLGKALVAEPLSPKILSSLFLIVSAQCGVAPQHSVHNSHRLTRRSGDSGAEFMW